jgi:hypothetical protein
LATTTALIVLLGFTVPLLAEAGVIKNREARQQKRIDQGAKSGGLTDIETARLARQQGKIEADREKALADGKITKKEKTKLTREQNRASRRIYRQKHDAQKQGTAN